MAPYSNYNLPQIDLHITESMADAPASFSSPFLCGDISGNHRYLYGIFSLTSFYRYDTWANCWQQLANPPAGTAVVSTGSCAVFDPSRGTSGYLWLFVSDTTNIPTFQYYDLALNTWTTRTGGGGGAGQLPAVWGGYGAIVHPCINFDFNGKDDSIYLIGNGNTPVWEYSISGNTWSTLANALPSLARDGSGLFYLPKWSPNKIVAFCNPSSAVTIPCLYAYNFNTPAAWDTLTITPNLERMGYGTGSCSQGLNSTNILVQPNITHKLYDLKLDSGGGNTATFSSRCTLPVTITSTTVRGTNKLCFVQTPSGAQFAYLGVINSTAFVRTHLLW